MTRPRRVDNSNKPVVPEPPPWKLGESSSSKLAPKPAIFTPLPETSELDPEPESEATEMASETFRKGMPNRRDPKAPFFDRNRPEELLRYIEDVENELVRTRVTSEQEKKDWLRYYADQRSADEWTVLDTYLSDGGSFKDFKDELISHYPEATDSLEGSITRLDKLCAKSTPLTNEYLSIVLEFIRNFKFEGRKLLRGGCISNREIVAKFLNCLDPELRRTVTWQMSQKSLNDVSTSEETTKKTRHHTDPIEFETLLKVSEDLMRSFNSYNTIAPTGTSGLTTRSTVRTQHTISQRPMEPATSSNRMVQLLEDLNGSMAKNTDVLVHMSKENSQRHDETAKSLNTMHTLLNTWHKGEAGKTNQSSLGSVRKCYYCWGVGHFVTDCQFLAADVAERKIETPDNGTKVDEKTFPKEPSHLSPKDRVKRLWKDRTQFFIEELPEDGTVELAPNSLVALQSNWNRNQTQFFIEDPSLPEDGIIDLMPDGIVTLQKPIFNLNVRDERDKLISELQEKARRTTEERDMWKAVTDTGQMNLSVPIAPQVSQSVPQSTAQPVTDMEFMTMLAKMMSLSTQESVEKASQSAQ
jgi:hypothetical protein